MAAAPTSANAMSRMLQGEIQLPTVRFILSSCLNTIVDQARYCLDTRLRSQALVSRGAQHSVTRRTVAMTSENGKPEYSLTDFERWELLGRRELGRARQTRLAPLPASKR
jgi:hypothetical protein